MNRSKKQARKQQRRETRAQRKHDRRAHGLLVEGQRQAAIIETANKIPPDARAIIVQIEAHLEKEGRGRRFADLGNEAIEEVIREMQAEAETEGEVEDAAQ
jgi:hypothetical protein